MRRRPLWRLSGICVIPLLLAACGAARAQLRPFGDAAAIVGARIEIGDGRVIEKGTVLVRDGLIEAVGADLAAPPDAEVVAGDGLIVFPGFIDCWWPKGLKLPDAQPNQDLPPDTGAEASPSMREANRKGVRPEVSAAELLALTEPDLAAMRKAGFTTALVAPTGSAINGTAALVDLDGRPRRECIVRPAAGMDFGFATVDSGSYPITLLGVIAQIRQALLDAGRYRRQQAAFEKGSARRPPHDDALAALLPVLDGALPALFEADGANPVERAVRLTEGFGIRPVIVGGKEAWKEAAMLAEQHVPVIVALDFVPEPKLPAPPGEKPGASEPSKASAAPASPSPAAGAPPPAAAPATPVPSQQEDLDMPEAAARERRRRWEEGVANALRLHEAGIRLAFTGRGQKKPDDFWEDLRRVVRAGLPREAALQALTLDPARILGIERQMGTVEAGKIANLTIMTADFTDPKAKARYLFIDGRKVDLERETPMEPAPPGAPAP